MVCSQDFASSQARLSMVDVLAIEKITAIEDTTSGCVDCVVWCGPKTVLVIN